MNTSEKGYIFGIRPVIEAIRSGKSFEKIFLRKGMQGEGFRDLFTLIRELEIPFQFVPAEKLNRLSKQNHQGVIAWLTEITYQKIEDIIPAVFERGETPLILYLDGITDVRNMGAIARTAECAGVHALILPARGSALINSEAIKTSAGALYKIPVCRTSHPAKTIHFLKDSGLEVFASAGEGSVEYTHTQYDKPLVLILGSEGQGISPDILETAGTVIRIPLSGEIDSLNVSVASGVLLFEILRQRKS